MACLIRLIFFPCDIGCAINIPLNESQFSKLILSLLFQPAFKDHLFTRKIPHLWDLYHTHYITFIMNTWIHRIHTHIYERITDVPHHTLLAILPCYHGHYI